MGHLRRETLVWAQTIVRIPNNQSLTKLAHQLKDMEGFFNYRLKGHLELG